jgi:uncharacterized membrane protein
MKLFAFLVAAVLFVGSFALFSYAFSFGDSLLAALVFLGGIAAVALSLAIPFHLLRRLD